MQLVLDALLSRDLTWQVVVDFLSRCPSVIGMEKVGAPYVFHDGNLWIGFILLKTSHISLHAQDRLFHLDIFSCKPFDAKKTLDFIQASFPLEEIIQAQRVQRTVAVFESEEEARKAVKNARERGFPAEIWHY